MGRHSVILIPGDGIGPEVVGAAQAVIEATGVDIAWTTYDVGLKAVETCGTTIPHGVLEAIRSTGVALKGPVTTPIAGGFTSVSVTLRRELGLYANLRLACTMQGIPSRYTDVDLVVVRENTEDLYSGVEVRVDDDTAEAVKHVTRAASLRIAGFAFAYARNEGRTSVTTVHKANILKLTDGLFLECAREVADRYPEIEHRERIVDALCMDLVVDPARHDVLLCPNLYGDIVSDLAAGLVGGLGVVPAANIGEGIAMFEAVHGSAPDVAGLGVANPTAVILAGAMMLWHLGEQAAATSIRKAVQAVYALGDVLTPDVGGTATTEELAEAVISELPQ
jgi:isocitrate dehydrogenase (NAD+)